MADRASLESNGWTHTGTSRTGRFELFEKSGAERCLDTVRGRVTPYGGRSLDIRELWAVIRSIVDALPPGERAAIRDQINNADDNGEA